MCIRDRLDSARSAAQQALRAACVGARAPDDRCEIVGDGEPPQGAEEHGNAGQQQCPPPRSAPA
eukprot:11712339-Alexandrium_andersonii.AAC.1